MRSVSSVTRGALAEPAREHRRAPHLDRHELVELLLLEQEELGARRLALRVGQPHDDAIVGGDRGAVKAVAFANAR